MTLYGLLIALLLQAAPAAQSPAPKASVAGVAVNAAGEPLAGVRVALARTDVSLGAISQLIAGDRPQVEMTMPATALAIMVEEIASEVQNGNVTAADAPQLNAEAAAFKSLLQMDIEELIISPTGSVAAVSKTTPPAMTDDRGRFAFSDVAPGTYRLIFSGNGYAKQDYGQRSVGGAGIPLTLAGGQAKTDIVMRLMAVAAVSGHIRDIAGQSVASVPVQLFHFTYDESGQRKEQVIAATRTDDRGDYRMYYLSPGRYYMRAGNPPGQNSGGAVPNGLEALMLGGGYSTQNRIPQNYSQMYYPGVAEASAATTLEVQSGADLRNVDLLVNAQQTYRVRGRVVDPRTGQPPANATISINALNPDRSAVIFFNGGNNSNYKAADGTFELTGVGSGAHSVTASIPNPQPTRQPDFSSMSPAERSAYFETMDAADRASPKAFATVKVVNADVDGLLLAFGNGSSVAGRVRVESSAPNPAVSLDLMRVVFRDPSGSSAVFLNNTPQSRPISADGAFRIENVWPGDYRLAVTGIPPGFYVKEARLGNVDVLNAPVRYLGPDSNTLEVVISTNVGAIEGTVADAAGKPAAGAQVVLIPGNLGRTELFRPVPADSSGRFSISGIAPGEYTLAAWETLEPFAFFDPNVIRQAVGQGKTVKVAEASSQTVNMTAIP